MYNHHSTGSASFPDERIILLESLKPLATDTIASSQDTLMGDDYEIFSLSNKCKLHARLQPVVDGSSEQIHERDEK